MRRCSQSHAYRRFTRVQSAIVVGRACGGKTPGQPSDMNTARILKDLDKHASEFNFPVLDNAYIELAAARLSAFQGVKDWLIIFEVLGFSTKEMEFVDDLVDLLFMHGDERYRTIPDDLALNTESCGELV